MFERVAGELRATLGVDSAAMCARAGDEACGAKARSGRVSRHSTEPPISDKRRRCGGRRRGLAGLRGAAPSHPAHRKRHWCGGRRRERRAWPRCRWAVAGPGRASRRRAEPKARGADGSRAGRRPPAHPAARPHSRALRRPEHQRCHTATTRGPTASGRAGRAAAGTPAAPQSTPHDRRGSAGFTRPRGGRPRA